MRVYTTVDYKDFLPGAQDLVNLRLGVVESKRSESSKYFWVLPAFSYSQSTDKHKLTIRVPGPSDTIETGNLWMVYARLFGCLN